MDKKHQQSVINNNPRPPADIHVIHAIRVIYGKIASAINNQQSVINNNSRPPAGIRVIRG